MNARDGVVIERARSGRAASLRESLREGMASVGALSERACGLQRERGSASVGFSSREFSSRQRVFPRQRRGEARETNDLALHTLPPPSPLGGTAQHLLSHHQFTNENELDVDVHLFAPARLAVAQPVPPADVRFMGVTRGGFAMCVSPSVGSRADRRGRATTVARENKRHLARAPTSEGMTRVRHRVTRERPPPTRASPPRTSSPRRTPRRRPSGSPGTA